MRSFSRAGLSAVTAATMATATFPVVIVSVLAAELIEKFEITRVQVGLLVTASGLVGAFASLVFGRLTDRVGGTAATRSVLVVGMFTLTAFALAPSYVLLLVAALATGVPNGWTNPATNTLIVDNVPVGQRGTITGLKQSGVQVGTLLGGLLLPVFATLWSWRIAVLLFLVMPLSGLVAMRGRGRPPVDGGSNALASARLPSAVRWIALYGWISGLATSAIFGFLPLFAEEDQMWSPQAAGSLLAAVGVTGVAARIFWPRASEKGLGHGPTLRILSILSTITAVLLALAASGTVSTWVLVPTSLLFGAGSVAWNAVGMLAVMDLSPPGMVGKGTGVVLFGFLLGSAAGPPLMGFSVDTLGSYQAGWLVAAGLLLVAALIAGRVPVRSTLVDS